MKFKWQLINDSITDDDKKALTDFINEPNQRFTQGKKVKELALNMKFRKRSNKQSSQRNKKNL